MAGQLSLFGDTPPPKRPRRPGKHLLFFALRPPETVAREIIRQRLEVMGAPLRGTYQVALRRLHITLQLVGQYASKPSPTVINAASCAAASVRLPPFEICFDHIMTFSGGAVVMRMPKRNEALSTFRNALVDALDDIEMPIRSDRSFTPHVTLSYGDGFEGERRIEPIKWRVADFVLIDSYQGQTRHEQVGKWPLDI